MPDGCLRYSADRLPPTEADDNQPLHGPWRDVGEALAVAGPLTRGALRRRLGWDKRRIKSTTYFMRLAGMIEGRAELRLSARGRKRLAYARAADRG